VERFFKLDSGKPDFVSITPRQARRLIAKVAVPSQRRLQRKVSLLYKRDHVIRIPRLFRNANAHESKQYPGKNRSDSRWDETSDSYKEDSGQNENSYHYERRCEEKKRSGISGNRGMQAEHDTAGECRSDRYARQPHGTLRNLTSVSM
jgi:hypothetical protein